MEHRTQPLVLGYHTVNATWDHPAAVRPDALRVQLDRLHSAGFRSVTFSEAVSRPRGTCVAVTFDDAFLAVHELALPMMTERGMVGTVFVPTSVVSTSGVLSWDGFDGPDRGTAADMQSMTWDHLRDLAARGWEIGSHTRTHRHLPRLDDETLRDELVLSRHECSAQLGTGCTTLAYPYGEVDLRVRAAARAAGYQAAAALGPQWRRADVLWWPRTGIYRDDDPSRFALKIHPLAQSRAFAAGVTTARRLAGTRA